MSPARLSPKRIPASKPLSTISARPSSVTTSTFTHGYFATKRASKGASTSQAAGRGTFRRSVPAGTACNAVTSTSASATSRKAGASRAKRRFPASVGVTLRVVRWSKRTPSRSSSPRMAWLRAEADTPRSAAALRKLRCRATASKASSSCRSIVILMRIIQ